MPSHQWNATTGVQYDRDAIEKWAKERGCDPHDPQHKLELEDVHPNVGFRNLIIKFIKAERAKGSSTGKEHVSLDTLLDAGGGHGGGGEVSPRSQAIVAARSQRRQKRKQRRSRQLNPASYVD